MEKNVVQYFTIFHSHRMIIFYDNNIGEPFGLGLVIILFIHERLVWFGIYGQIMTTKFAEETTATKHKRGNITSHS